MPMMTHFANLYSRENTKITTHVMYISRAAAAADYERGTYYGHVPWDFWWHEAGK